MDEQERWGRTLKRKLDALPRAIEPPRDLWPGVEARLSAEHEAPSWRGERGGRRLLAAAAVAVVLGGSLVVGKLGGSRRGEDLVAAPARSTSAEAPVPTPPEWTAATEELLRALDASGDGLDPATREVVARNLEIIDEAVREIRAALDADPQNAGLQKLLTAEYRRRSALMRRAAGSAAI
jgi:hypothetical protein